MRTLRIGYTSNGYQVRKNLLGFAPACEYVLVRDLHSSLRRLWGLTRPRWTAWEHDAQYKFLDFGLNRVDLVHLYNGVSFGRRPWVTTFETVLPRFRSTLDYRFLDAGHLQRRDDIRRALDALAGPACRAIIARTQNTVVWQEHFLRLFPAHRDSLLSKVTVLMPPQAVSEAHHHSPDSETLSVDSPIHFMFVGHQFFSKGGREVVKVLEEFRRSHGDRVRLTLVSLLKPDGYATAATEKDRQHMTTYLAANQHWITHHRTLPHAAVQALMQRADVGLLPSHHEAFGLSVLEFQSHGVPVITTNIRSFPEINNEQVGWVLPVPVTSDGEAPWPQGEAEIRSAIEAGLRTAIRDILDRPQLVRERGAAARARVARDHDPLVFGQRLRETYERALQ